MDSAMTYDKEMTEDWKSLLQWDNVVHVVSLTQNLCHLILRLNDGLKV
jgi:hypothetical protein